MGPEPPVLEYARAERVGGDRYRLWFLLAGLPAMAGLCVPIGHLGSLSREVVRALGQVTAGGLSAKSMFEIAMITVVLSPLSAFVWRVLRRRDGKAGQIAGLIGLTLAGIHVMAILGLLGTLMFEGRGDARMLAAALAGIILATCGILLWRNRRRLDLDVWVLLVLAGVEMAFWALLGVIVLARMGMNAWGLVFAVTAVLRGVESWHVLQSRWMGEQSV